MPAHVQEACPQQTHVTSVLAHCITLVDTVHPDTPVDTEAQHVSQEPAVHGGSQNEQHAPMHAGYASHALSLRETVVRGFQCTAAGERDNRELEQSTKWLQQNSAGQSCMPTDFNEEEGCEAFGAFASDSCMSACAAALHELHSMIPEGQRESSCFNNTNSDGLEDSLHMHGAHASIHDSAGALNPCTVDMRAQASSVRIWSECLSKFNPDWLDACEPESASHSDPTTRTSTFLENGRESTVAEPSGATDGGNFPAQTQQKCMHAMHECTSSDICAGASVNHGSCASQSYVAHACQQCTGCETQQPKPTEVQQPHVTHSTMRERIHACPTCMACIDQERGALLGECGETVKELHDALTSFQDIHSSDALMHFEFAGPFLELTEVRIITMTVGFSAGDNRINLWHSSSFVGTPVHHACDF